MEKILLALILAGTIGAIAGYLGSLMLSKRMALMGGALGHLILPGVALALLYDFDVSIGAALFLAFGVLIIWLLEQKTRLHLEALTAVVFFLRPWLPLFCFCQKRKSISLYWVMCPR